MAELIGSFAPIRIGETRTFVVKSIRIARVGIRCVVRPPEPAEDRECAECGEFQKVADSVNKKVEVINSIDYGMMKGDKILDHAITLLG